MERAQRKRVVVTGLGAVTPLGLTFGETWGLVKEGVSGIGRITRFDSSALRWRVAGEVKGFDPLLFLTRREIVRMDPFVRYAVASAIMAAGDAGLAGSPLLEASGVVIGSSRGGISTLEREARKLDGGSRLSAFLMASTTISMAASEVAMKLRAKGHCTGLSNACASGTTAIGEGYRLIRDGYSRLVLAGGAEAPVCSLAIKGYGVAGALSETDSPSASRPFDISRDGFVLAEGACILVLEEYRSAMERGARIYGEIRGYGNATDAFHMIRPDGEGEARAVSAALQDAGIPPEMIGLVSAHGTSTPLGDRAEAEAIGRVWGRRSSSLPVFALKSMTGHMLGASGALETACTLMAMREGIVPPTLNLSGRDPACDIGVAGGLRENRADFGVVESFGFGGVNSVLALRTSSDGGNGASPL